MFTRAIIKKPSSRFCEGITTSPLGMPDLSLAREQHNSYKDALLKCSLDIIELEQDDLPDSCFVEDAAVIINELAVITNPGAASRKKEILPVENVLKKLMTLSYINSPGTLDGGDVMQAENHFYIGISGRTNIDGAEQFKKIIEPLGYTCSFIPVKTVLHLKTGITYIGNNTMLAIDEFVSAPEFKSYDIIPVPQNEAYAANAIDINGKLLFPHSFPATGSILDKLGFIIIEVNMTEFEKMDGGLTCLSLRF